MKNTSNTIDSKFLLQNLHRVLIINVLNKTGDIHLGEIICILPKDLLLPEFKIINKNRLLRIINRKVNLLKVDCDNKDFENYIQNSLIKLGLEEIARNSQFEPKINGNKGENYRIVTNYSLVFSRKKEVIKPLINFYKALIDYTYK